MVHGMMDTGWNLNGRQEINIGKSTVLVRPGTKKVKNVDIKTSGSFPVIVEGQESDKAIIQFKVDGKSSIILRIGEGLTQKKVNKGRNSHWNMVFKNDIKGFILAIDSGAGEGIFGLEKDQEALIICPGSKSYFLKNDGKDVTCIDPRAALKMQAYTSDVSSMKSLF